MAGQLWSVTTLGGYMYSDELSDVLRTAVQPLSKFRQFSDAKDQVDKGLHRGQLFTWDLYSDVAVAGTAIAESQAMPETNFIVAQGTGTVREFGNSVPYTGLLDNLSKHPVQEIINKVLKNDCVRSLDRAAHDQFDLTPLRVTAVGGTSTDSVVVQDTSPGVGVTTNNVVLGKDIVKSIVDAMKERNIPTYDGDDYMAIARPSTWRPLKNDLESVYKYRDEGFRMIYNGEIGKYEGVRFIEQTNIPTEKWKNGKSDWAYFFGEDTVAEGIVIPEEMRGKIPGDYGRSKGIAWYYLGGFALTQKQPEQARILKWSQS